MYAYEWGEKSKAKEKFNQYDFKNIRKNSLLVWSEHCTECAEPICYKRCEKYRKRADGKCKLFKNGISRIYQKGCLSHYSYTVHFEGWAKLESFYRVNQHCVKFSNMISQIFHFIFVIAKNISKIFERKKDIWGITTLAYKAREFISNVIDKFGKKPDMFLISVGCPIDNVNLVLEVKNKQELLYRKSFLLNKGYQQFMVDYDEFKFETIMKKTNMFVYPDKEVELQFYALDFVTLDKKELEALNHAFKIDIKPDQKKIKCIVWDLDNTLWKGVLIEEKVTLNKEIAEIIKDLDQKGIVNSIVSKNNFNEAYEKIKEYHLDEYIVMPHINWLPKSININDLAKKMNIGLDTIAFVDDSPFELSEVKENCPEVLCINTLNVNEIKQLDCFNVIVTEDSKNRRKTYKMMESQQKELENWTGNIDDFLKSCNMKLIISEPKNEEIQRCYELLQRTNQLNASGRRLSLDEVNSIINNKKDYATYVLKCNDKFGDYGIVGFAIVNKKSKITITDFVISCRVANKKVEHAFIQSIFDEYSSTKESIFINYKKTIKNGPIYKVVQDLNMKQVNVIDELETYEYKATYADRIDIVTVERK